MKGCPVKPPFPVWDFRPPQSSCPCWALICLWMWPHQPPASKPQLPFRGILEGQSCGRHSKDGDTVVSDGGQGGGSWRSSRGSRVRMETRWSLTTAHVVHRGSPAPSPEGRRLTWPQGTFSWQPQHITPGFTDSWNQPESWPGRSHLSQDWTSPAEPQTPMPGMVKGPGRKGRALPARGWRSQAGLGSDGPDLEPDLHTMYP